MDLTFIMVGGWVEIYEKTGHPFSVDFKENPM